MSKRVVGNSALTTFDVCVIGSGAGAGPVIYLCAKYGLKVLVIEAGVNHLANLDDPTQQPVPEYSNDELKFEARSFIETDSIMDPRAWRTKPSDGDRLSIGDVNSLPKHVGGGMIHADVKMPRFEEQDFMMGTLLGSKVQNASFADWPISYADLEPFYSFAERQIGVQGKLGANPFEPPRSSDYPMPPGLPMYLSTVAAQGLALSGYTAFPYPTAVNSQPYDGRPACADCGYCEEGCPINAKGSTAVTMIRKALLTGNCLMLAETRATKLVMNAAKDTVTAVECIDPVGNVVQYTASRYVLAASPIEDARLLLLSDPGGKGVGNSSDMLGRNLMFHLQTSVVGIFNERLHGHRGRIVDHGFADFRGKAVNYNPSDASTALGGIVEISGSEHPISEAGFYSQILFQSQFKLDGRVFKKLLRQAPFRDRIIVFTMQAEDAPQPTNRVDLDPAVVDFFGTPAPRVTYSNSPYELAASSYRGPLMVDPIFKNAGARWSAVTPRDTIPASKHVMGTLRFGKDPTSSVCDPTGKLHDITNLYCSDGALFPTSSGYNPTMTIVSLSCWVGSNMVFPGAPQRALW